MKSLNIKYPYILPRSTVRNVLKALIVLFIGLGLTAIATFYAQQKAQADAKQEFSATCKEIKIKTANRLRACAQLLRNGSAFFVASDRVSREDWKTFNDYSRYEINFPGIKGIGYSEIIPGNQIKQHIQKIRDEGFPEYSLKPAGERSVYTSIIYIEPFTGDNLRSFGYDMFSDSIRKRAMELSRDSDFSAISGKVILVQNSDDDLQESIIIYVPVYEKGTPLNTINQRRAAIKGWVFSPYHMADLMGDILGNSDLKHKDKIRLQIYDENVTSNSVLFDSQKGDTISANNKSINTLTSKITLYNKKWVLVFTQLDNGLSSFQNLARVVLISGILISILLFLLSISLLNTRGSAQKMAYELTHDLKESEERIREVLENSMDASYKRNLKTQNYEYLSPSYTRITDYSTDEIKDLPMKALLDLYHPDDVTEVNRILARSMNDDTPSSYQLEYRFQHKDGGYRWFQDRYTILRDEQNQPLALIGSVSDVTYRKQAEQALKDERLLLRTLIDNIPDSIYCLDVECRKTLANITDLRYMGAKSEAEVLGKNDFDFYSKEIAEKFFEVDNSVIQTGKPILNVEEYLIEKNGEIRWLLTSKLPMFNNEGQIIGLLGYGRDITERKKAEEEIKAKNEELQKLNSAKDKFFSIIAHDLRSPFNGFLGLTQMMAEDLSNMTLDEIQAIAHSMRNSATTLYRLLENLLQWSTLQQNRMAFQPVLLSLNPVIEESISIVLESAKSKEIEIICLISGQIEIFADLKMVQTILRNLVSNAIKFTKKGGKIDLTARNLDNGFTEISIKDSGIGMNREMKERLFLLDTNSSRKGTEGETSTGLGLIICKDFVEMHGGEIGVESEEGIGSIFYFTIPSKEIRPK